MEFTVTFVVKAMVRHHIFSQHPQLIYILSGIVTATIVVVIYDFFLGRRRKKAERKLKQVNNAVLKKYDYPSHK
jgi:uncharacterized membrane protein (DUF106 family)